MNFKLKHLFLVILFIVISFVEAYSQTVKDAKLKTTNIFKFYYKYHIPYEGNSKHIKVGDSVILMLKSDMWFSTLSEPVQKGKIFRVKYYQRKAEGKYKKNQVYLKGWIYRIYSTHNY